MNLDKYEGHTPGPWTVFVDDGDGDFDRPILQIEGPTHTIAYDIDRPSNSSGGSDVANIQTAKLIADSPLFLEEVKRLQGRRRLLLAEVKRLREWIYHHAKNLDAGGVHTFADEAREAIE